MFRYLPPATRRILFANVVVFALQLLTGGAFDGVFALQPLGPAFEPWQVLTYAFLHSTSFFLHIVLNMFALFMFGPELERLQGTARFVVLYFASVLAAAFVQLAVTPPGGEATEGASGGIFGLLFAFAFYFPRRRLYVIPIPIPLPAWLFVTLYGLVELLLGVTHTEVAVAHFAHLGGMLGAALVILFWRLQARTG